MAITKPIKFISKYAGYKFYFRGKKHEFVNGVLETKDPQLISAFRKNKYFGSDFHELIVAKEKPAATKK